MLDVAVSYNRYKFLGNEFLTWLWFAIDNRAALPKGPDGHPAELHIGNRMALENYRNEAVERVTIRGDQAGQEEGKLALRKGAVVTEVNLIYKSGHEEWQFTIKGESLNLSGLKTPEAGQIESGEELEGRALESVYLIEKAVALVGTLYETFIQLRIGNTWDVDVVAGIRRWIAA